MTRGKLLSIFQQYYEMLRNEPPLPISEKQLDPPQYSEKAGGVGPVRGMSHVMWMCVEAQKFVAEGRIEKAMRWLGFIQGVLWMGNTRTLNELRDDSKPATGMDSIREAEDDRILRSLSARTWPVKSWHPSSIDFALAVIGDAGSILRMKNLTSEEVSIALEVKEGAVVVKRKGDVWVETFE